MGTIATLAIGGFLCLQLTDGTGPGSAEDEDEQRHEGEVDEEHRLDQTHRQEEDGLEAALRLGLAGDALDVGRAGKTVTDTGTDRTAGEGDAAADEGTGRGHGGVSNCHCDLLSLMFAPGSGASVYLCRRPTEVSALVRGCSPPTRRCRRLVRRRCRLRGPRARRGRLRPSRSRAPSAARR